MILVKEFHPEDTQPQTQVTKYGRRSRSAFVALWGPGSTVNAKPYADRLRIDVDSLHSDEERQAHVSMYTGVWSEAWHGDTPGLWPNTPTTGPKTHYFTQQQQ